MNNVNINSRLQKNDNVVHRAILNDRVLLNLDSGFYYSANEVGSRLWELCDGEKTIKDIIDIISPEYDVSLEKLTEDIMEFINLLYHEELLTITD